MTDQKNIRADSPLDYVQRARRASRGVGNSVLLVAFGLLAVTVWEASLHGIYFFMQSPGPEPLGYGVTISYWWYALQTVQLWGWLLVAGFMLACTVLRAGLVGSARSGLLIAGRWLLVASLAAGLVTAFAGSPETPGPRAMAAMISQSLLLLAGILFTLELLLLFRGRAMDIGGLFLLLAAQWMLVWLAAAVSLQWQLRDDPMGDPSRMRLLTLLPALVFGVHLAMAFACRILPGARHRAMLLGLALFNAGVITTLLPASASTILIVGRAILFGVTLLAAIFLFLAGLKFLRSRLPGSGGVMLWLAFAWLGLGVLLAAAEPVLRFFPSVDIVSPSYVALWREMLTAGFLGSLVIGFVMRLLPLCVPQNLQTQAPAVLVAAFWTAGVTTHGIGFLAAVMNNPHILWCMALGSAMQLIGVVILCLLVVRTVVAARRVRGSELTAATGVGAIGANAGRALEATGIGMTRGDVPVGVVALAWGWGVRELVELLRKD